MQFSNLFRKKTVKEILNQVAKNEAEGHHTLGKHLSARDLTAFGNCPFNASNLSLSVYGNNSILGGAANNPYNRGAYAMMNGLHNMSPNRPPLLENYPSPYGRPSMDTQQTRRQTSKF